MQITLNEIFRFVRTLEDGKLANQTGWTLYLRKFPFLSNDILGIEIEGEPGVYKFPVTESGYYKLWAGANFETLEEEPSYGNDIGKYINIPEWQSDESNIFISSTGKNVNIASNLNVAGTLSANQIIFSSVTAIELSVTGQELNFLGSVSITGDNVPPIAQNLFDVYKPDSTIPSFLVTSSGDVAINSNLSLSGNQSITGNINATEINSQSYKANDILGIDNNPSANTLSRITTSKGIVTGASNIAISSITSGLTSNTIWNKSLSSVFPSFNSDNVAIGNSALTSHKLSVSGNALITSANPTIIISNSVTATSPGVTNSQTITNFTVANNPNRLLLIGVSIRGNTSDTDAKVLSVVFGSTSATKLAEAANTNAQPTMISELWYIKNPSVTSANITASLTSELTRRFTIGAVSLYNVHQTNTFGTVSTVNPTNITSISADIVSEIGDLAFGLFSKRNSDELGTANSTTLWNFPTSNVTEDQNVVSCLAYRSATSLSSNLQYTWSANRGASMIGVAVKQVPDIRLSISGNTSITGSFSLQGKNALQLNTLTTSERDLHLTQSKIQAGMIFYNVSISGLQFYTGTAWKSITGF